MTKIADSYFIDPDTGKRIPVRMEYTGVFKPDTTMITTHNVYRLNNGVAEKLDGSGWRQPNTDDPNYWKTNIRQAAKNQEEPLNSVKYYWNKFTNWIKENKNGGNMNYASYLQGGGPAPLNAAPQVSKEDIAEIITAALLGTDEVKQQASEMLQSMLQDDSIAPLVLQVMEEMGVPMQKCGGRVKKKALGSKLIKTQKAKCGCELQKVGGRLIEVDSCTGLPVHKVGGKVLKFEDGKTIWQKWLGKITQKPEVYEPNPIYIEHERTGRETPVLMTPGYTYVSKTGKDRAYYSDDYNTKIKHQDEYFPMPDGRIHSREADEAHNVLNANRQPSTLTTSELPAVDINKLQTDALNKQRSADLQAAQQAQAAQAQRVRTFYSKMSDSDKRALQDMLKSAGYYKGEIDGLIGNGTLSALRKFQQDNKLAVDGMAGRNTIDALRAKTRQVAQPTTDPTAVPGYTQAMQLLNQMNGSISATPVKTGGPAGGMGLNDVHQSRDVQLVGPKVGLNLTAGLEIPQRKQGGQLNYANYLN